MVVTEEKFAALQHQVQQLAKTISPLVQKNKDLEEWRDQATSEIADHKKEIQDKDERLARLELRVDISAALVQEDTEPILNPELQEKLIEKLCEFSED